MRAAVIHETGDPEVLVYEEVPDPIAGDGQLLVAVEAISIEGGDVLARAGSALHQRFEGHGHIVGYQSAGTVVEVGPGVEGFTVGDRVTTVGVDGSHASMRAVFAAAAWKIPDGLTTEQAACVPVPFGTAHEALFSFARLVPGETVLVHAGGSGVGLAAIQLAKSAGAHVLTTASSDDKLERLAAFGVDHGINYSTSHFPDEIRRLTSGRGADVILDTVGGDVLVGSIASLAYKGRVISIGDAGRQGGEPIDVSPLRGQNQSLIGFFLGAELFLSPDPHRNLTKLLDELAQGAHEVVIDRRFPLEEAALAHAYIEARKSFGRVLLIP